MMPALLLALSLLTQPAPLPDPGRGIFSVTSYGARDGMAFDSTAGFEAAVAAAGRSLTLAAGRNPEPHPVRVVRVPSGTYALSRTLWLPPGARLQGDGWSSHLVVPNDARRSPAVVVGVPDPLCTAADRPDLFGVLDATACPAPGARRGWSTPGKVLAAHHNDLNLGRSGRWPDGDHSDYWERTPVLTLDACLVRDPAKPWPAGVPLLGLGVSGEFSDPRPWALRTHPALPGWLQFLWAESSLAPETPGGKGISFPVPDGRVLRLSVMIDLAGGRTAVWANGVQAATNGDTPAGGAFRGNDDMPLVVGGDGFTTWWAGSDRQPAFTLAGLALTAGERYAVGRPGDPQARADGKPIGDAWRYFSDRFGNPGSIAYLPLTDPIPARTLTVYNANGSSGFAYALRAGQGGSLPVQVADLSLACPGPGILLGACLDVRVTGVRINSGAGPALGAVPVGLPTYPVRVRDCRLDSGDACVEPWGWALEVSDTSFGSWGRHAIRSRGVGGTFRSCDFGVASPSNLTLGTWRPWGLGEGVLRLADLTVDSELGGFKDAVFEVWATPGMATTVSAERLTVALTGPTAPDPRPVVRLRGDPVAGSDVRVSAVVTSGCSEVVACDRAGWLLAADAPLARPAPRGPPKPPVPAAPGTVQLGGSNAAGAPTPDLGGVRLGGPTDPYYADVTAAPVHPRSAALLATMCHGAAGEPWPDFLTALLHPTHYGFPLVVVPEGQPLVPVDYDPTFGFPQFGVRAAPVPDSFPLEGTAAGDPTPAAYPNDQHGIVVVRDDATGGVKEVYELYSVFRPKADSHWTVSRLAWKYRPADRPEDRPDGMPTTTAGGTRILPGLIQYDDVVTRGVIPHALRMTCLSLGGSHVYPARANAAGDPDRPPEGTRLRLKASVDLSGFSPGARVVLRALQTYGAVLDDNGPNFQLQGTRDPRWKPYQFNDEFQRIKATDFEVLDAPPGYVLTPPPALSGPPGVESGAFRVALGEPAANVGTGGGQAAGFVLKASLPGGAWRVNGAVNYRVSLDSDHPAATFTYTPPAGTAPGTIITLSWDDNTVGRVPPPPVTYTVTAP